MFPDYDELRDAISIENSSKVILLMPYFEKHKLKEAMQALGGFDSAQPDKLCVRLSVVEALQRMRSMLHNKCKSLVIKVIVHQQNPYN